MELLGEEGLRDVPDALVGSVVQVDKERFPVCRQRGRVHGISVVLGRNVTPVRAYAAHGLVVAAVTVRQLESLRAGRQGHELAPEANAEDRPVSLQRLTEMGDGLGTHRRVAGAVGQEQAVIVHAREIVIPRYAHHLDAPGNQTPQDIVLDPQSTSTTRFGPFP